MSIVKTIIVPRSYGCEEFGARVVASYAAGRKASSAALAVPGKPRIDGDAYTQAVGRAGECAAAIYLHLDPAVVLNWGDELDDGADFVVNSRGVDVKTSPLPYARRLIWPVTKDIRAARSDFLVAARIVEWTGDMGHVVELFGWYPRSEFERNATLGGRNLVAGTMSIGAEELLHMEWLLPSLRSPFQWWTA